MTEIDTKSLKAIIKAWELTVVKDNPDDTVYDSLVKIGRLLRPIVTRYDVEYAWYEAHRENEAFDDEAERKRLWGELTD